MEDLKNSTQFIKIEAFVGIICKGRHTKAGNVNFVQNFLKILKNVRILKIIYEVSFY